jgi:hypothetical protein
VTDRRGAVEQRTARLRLQRRLDTAVASLPEQPSTPTVVVDLDAFDANAVDLARRPVGATEARWPGRRPQ